MSRFVGHFIHTSGREVEKSAVETIDKEHHGFVNLRPTGYEYEWPDYEPSAFTISVLDATDTHNEIIVYMDVFYRDAEAHPDADDTPIFAMSKTFTPEEFAEHDSDELIEWFANNYEDYPV